MGWKNGTMKDQRNIFKMATTPETDSLPLKIDLWKRKFLLETIIFRSYVSFRECSPKSRASAGEARALGGLGIGKLQIFFWILQTCWKEPSWLQPNAWITAIHVCREMLLTKKLWPTTEGNSAPCMVPFPNSWKILLTNLGFSSPKFMCSKNSVKFRSWRKATPAFHWMATAMKILVAPLLILQEEGVVQIQFFLPECFGEIQFPATACAVVEKRLTFQTLPTGMSFMPLPLSCRSSSRSSL